MNQQKLSVSVSEPIARFVERYKGEHGIKTKSEVVEQALELLRERELERAYAEAAREIDPVWEVTSADGLVDDDWS
jgi:Arc/MetJ-type ribon-helix-helix transcriptional regulator